MDRVSVIMGVYNCETTLRRAIDSIVSQTYSDWEFIICDDGSRDSSYDIALEYQYRNPQKFIVIKNENNIGLAATLNKCMEYCSGEYIARMDADDESLPQRLEKQVEFLNHYPEYAIVGCCVNKFDEGGIWKNQRLNERPVKEDLLWTSIFIHPTVVMRKEALEAVNYYRTAPETLRCEDYDLWLRMYAKGFLGYNLQETYFNYYEGKESYPKRKYRYRVNEAKIRCQGYLALGLMPKALRYVIKPLIVGLIPGKFFAAMKRIWR